MGRRSPHQLAHVLHGDLVGALLARGAGGVLGLAHVGACESYSGGGVGAEDVVRGATSSIASISACTRAEIAWSSPISQPWL